MNSRPAVVEAGARGQQELPTVAFGLLATSNQSTALKIGNRTVGVIPPIAWPAPGGLGFPQITAYCWRGARLAG
jgi:hypothetical protein